MKWDSALPLKVRVCEQTLSNWWYKMSNCLTSVFNTTQIEIVGGNWFTEGDICHLKLGQEVKKSRSLKDRLDLFASAARRTHGSTGLNLWAPEGALSNLLPIGKCCYYNGKRQENKEKTPREITYSPYWLQVCTKLHLKGSWVTSSELRDSSPSNALAPGFCVLLCSRRWWNVFQNMYV